jgi:tRNA (guanine37-N1)-methyltransferase
VLLTPQGHLLSQRRIVELTYYNHVVLLCGRYEGVDERVRAMVDEELSIGDYVLACGEPAAWVVIDGVSRLVPGVMGSQESSVEESHSNSGLLEYPQYTRPREFHGLKVPEVLLNGNHAMIKHWRTQQSMLRTLERRPDIFKKSQ